MDWLEGCRPSHNEIFRGDMADDNLNKLFVHLDQNQDGLLCPEDLSKQVRGLGFAKAWQLIAEMDRSGDGYVPQSEFQKTMKQLVHENYDSEEDALSWIGIYKSFFNIPMKSSKSSPPPKSAPAQISTLPPPAPRSSFSGTSDRPTNMAEARARRRSAREYEPPKETSTKTKPTIFASMRQLLRPVPATELPRSLSADDAKASESKKPRVVSSTRQETPVSSRSSRHSSSRLEQFLQSVPPNQMRHSSSSTSLKDDDERSNLAGQTANEEPFESPKPPARNDHRQFPQRASSSLSDAPSLGISLDDPEMDLFGRSSLDYRISDPEEGLFGPSSTIVQAQGIATQDFTHDNMDANPPSTAPPKEFPPAPLSQANSFQTLKSDITDCLKAIQAAVVQLTAVDEENARVIYASLLDIKTKLTVRNLPPVLGAALKSFDKSSLAVVDDSEKQYNSVSIQHVEQAMKIRAFRKNVLAQVFPQVPDHPLSVLGDLFPDILPDTIEQMFDACAQDLQSCFQVLVGLSDYSALDSKLSPKQSYLRKQPDKKMSFDGFEEEDEEDLDAPLFDIKGYVKPEKNERVVSKPRDSKPHGQYFALLPFNESDNPVPTTIPPRRDDIVQWYSDFESGQNMPEIMSAWARFHLDPSLHHSQVYPQLKKLLLPYLSFRQGRIFEILDKKRQGHALYTQQVAASKRVCIVGGGPVGLRCAIEIALLGGHVIVLEKRGEFTRENILHLYPWVVHDLTALGAKIFYRQFCMSSSHLHIGTRQLQCILLKTALMLGVSVFTHTSFDAFVKAEDGYSIQTSPPLPLEFQRVSALIGAGGSRDTIGNMVGIDRKAFSPSPAVGAVVIFPNTNTKEELAIKQFSWASQYNQELFGRLRDDLGVDVENIVYYRDEVHYIVMTPKKASLVKAGVLQDGKELTSWNSDALHRYVKCVLDFFKIPFPTTGVDAQLFDFSQTLRAVKAAVVLPHPTSKLFVALVGDALLEPFWPQGLGINRGFLSVLDTAFAITRLDKADDFKILIEHDKHYRCCTSLMLQANIGKFNVDPASRYKL
ncbi:hypothetical protein Ae201684P_015302 [Aphanomyces euteiches]|uniref:EF-hand domain-containing protein n=1 Tax=Aphanomyces euteiches TaxID=100861 RepID=A0A6G0XFD5_9STRA|nr:hypothetical protein Ae201684_005180 [Aphanomyces euteiches]KAH9053537.1 hypothetical protein Ae201684P_015302 [Aphanomyces euteiches]KAH9131784.1 hypothetical protein AeRB84_021619 [Aphanomyces euteiches]